MGNPAFVQAIKEHVGFENGRRTYAVRYKAVRAQVDPASSTPVTISSLVWTDESSKSFETFEEADAVVRIYNEGLLPDEAVRYHWDLEAGTWVVDEEPDYLYDGPGGIQDREDFHSDG